MSSDLDAAIEAARTQWPDLKADRATFRRQLHSGGARALTHAADLYLACACLNDDTAALRELARLVEGEVSRAVRHLRRDTAFRQDVGQQLLAKLLTPDRTERRKLEAYTGRGPLAAWLRAAALRTALNDLESEKPQVDLSRNLAAPTRGAYDAEAAVMRRRHSAVLKAAIEAALQAVPVEDRNVLRFYFVDGLTVERIARIRGTHKSTISRLISRIREQLREHIQADLAAEKNAKPEEVNSLARAVISQLDVSLERALR